MTTAMAAASHPTLRAFAQIFIASPPSGWPTCSFIAGEAVSESGIPCDPIRLASE